MAYLLMVLCYGTEFQHGVLSLVGRENKEVKFCGKILSQYCAIVKINLAYLCLHRTQRLTLQITTLKVSV